jgi:hypothetical protein
VADVGVGAVRGIQQVASFDERFELCLQRSEVPDPFPDIGKLLSMNAATCVQGTVPSSRRTMMLRISASETPPACATWMKCSRVSVDSSQTR